MREKGKPIYSYLVYVCSKLETKNKEREKHFGRGKSSCLCVEIDKLAARDSLTGGGGGGGGTKRDFFSVFVRERGRFGQRQKHTGGEPQEDIMRKGHFFFGGGGEEEDSRWGKEQKNVLSKSIFNGTTNFALCNSATKNAPFIFILTKWLFSQFSFFFFVFFSRRAYGNLHVR